MASDLESQTTYKTVFERISILEKSLSANNSPVSKRKNLPKSSPLILFESASYSELRQKLNPGSQANYTRYTRGKTLMRNDSIYGPNDFQLKPEEYNASEISMYKPSMESKELLNSSPCLNTLASGDPADSIVLIAEDLNNRRSPIVGADQILSDISSSLPLRLRALDQKSFATGTNNDALQSLVESASELITGLPSKPERSTNRLAVIKASNSFFASNDSIYPATVAATRAATQFTPVAIISALPNSHSPTTYVNEMNNFEDDNGQPFISSVLDQAPVFYHKTMLCQEPHALLIEAPIYVSSLLPQNRAGSRNEVFDLIATDSLSVTEFCVKAYEVDLSQPYMQNIAEENAITSYFTWFDRIDFVNSRFIEWRPRIVEIIDKENKELQSYHLNQDVSQPYMENITEESSSLGHYYTWMDCIDLPRFNLIDWKPQSEEECIGKIGNTLNIGSYHQYQDIVRKSINKGVQIPASDSVCYQAPVLPALVSLMDAGCLVKALYEYEAQKMDELTFEIGCIIRILQCPEGGWCKGIILANGLIGWFPSSFVEKFEDEVKIIKEVATLHTCLTPKPNLGSPIEVGSLVLAVYNYEAQKLDELTFEEGCLISIVECPEGGWYKGTTLSHPHTGWFPINYVEKINEKPVLSLIIELPTALVENQDLSKYTVPVNMAEQEQELQRKEILVLSPKQEPKSFLILPISENEENSDIFRPSVLSFSGPPRKQLSVLSRGFDNLSFGRTTIDTSPLVTSNYLDLDLGNILVT